MYQEAGPCEAQPRICDGASSPKIAAPQCASIRPPQIVPSIGHHVLDLYRTHSRVLAPRLSTRGSELTLGIAPLVRGSRTPLQVYQEMVRNMVRKEDEQLDMGG